MEDGYRMLAGEKKIYTYSGESWCNIEVGNNS